MRRYAYIMIMIVAGCAVDKAERRDPDPDPPVVHMPKPQPAPIAISDDAKCGRLRAELARLGGECAIQITDGCDKAHPEGREEGDCPACDDMTTIMNTLQTSATCNKKG